jgi:competence protein ComEA
MGDRHERHRCRLAGFYQHHKKKGGTMESRTKMGTAFVTLVFVLAVLAPVWAQTTAKTVEPAKAAAEPAKLAVVNINTANANQLAELKGVGPKVAETIIKHREANGPFKKPEDLMNVKGVGQKLFDQNKDRIVVK